MLASNKWEESVLKSQQKRRINSFQISATRKVQIKLWGIVLGGVLVPALLLWKEKMTKAT